VNAVTGYDLMRSYPTNDGDHARGCDCYYIVTRNKLTALSHTGHRCDGRRLLLLPSLRTGSLLLAVAVTGDVTAGYPPCRNSFSSLSSNNVVDGGLNCLD
jgi:hypothetical protein